MSLNKLSVSKSMTVHCIYYLHPKIFGIYMGKIPYILGRMYYHFISKRYSHVLGRILDHEMENLYASIPISFIMRTSSCNFFW
ncbi:Os04g0474550 [Oryza sativa Japonica Group]|uniref:Os04g0474550 protein n=2 Tax=Oryza sativa subsp. japonica TaxID=39947 RepID=C7J1Q1_ORYSJ|nr:hypothetical protein EE612_023928 [Oryza sativa]BAH92708.1 Os04g0474550 [Oryza sativa Japonica Group]BAS89671.1 Os04g0474550 [Oryza sativa Japonica Group]|eukprot:NP_001173980.1 Os04g0474550 [Oryza sativa Japonica Group]